MPWQDVRFAVRTLRKHPSFTFAAILALALGIGATTAIFSVVDAVLLRPLRYPEADRLLSVTTIGGMHMDFVISAEYLAWAESNAVFENYAAMWHNTDRAPLATPDGSTLIYGKRVTANFLATLRVAPLLGRSFLPEEARPDGPSPIILSYGLWQDKFARDPNILGRSIVFDGSPRQVVGVLPAAFHFPASVRVDALVPIKIDIAEVRSRRTLGGWDTIGRLKPGVSIEQARANLGVLFAASAAADPMIYQHDVELHVMPLRDRLTGNVRLTLLILLGAVASVLLIACANVANLLLTRAAGRRKEISIRVALGAGRRRLIRQLLIESLMLALAGGTCGMAIAAGVTGLLRRFAPADLPRAIEISMDARVLAFAFFISLVTGIVFGLAPAMSATRPVVRFTRPGPRGFLVATELALSLTLLIAAGLLFESLWRLQHKHLGFEPDSLLTTNVSVRGPRLDDLREQIAAFPGTQSIAFADSLPPNGGSGSITFSREDRPIPEPGHRGDGMAVRHVSPGYFETLHIPLVRGRFFNDRDAAHSSAIINETVARRYFPGEDPLGKKIAMRFADGPKTIVGVVGDTKNQGLGGEPGAEMDVSLSGAERSLYVIVRTAGEPAATAAALREVLRQMDPQMVATIHTMQQQFDEMTARPRFNGWLFGSFAAAALLLAVVGVYGVLSFTVASRMQEIGIRMALGADSARIFRLVIKTALVPTASGIAAGLLGAFGARRYLSSLLYDVQPTDFTTYVAVSLVLGTIAVAASLMPARRAIQIDPMQVLRAD